MKGVDVIGQMLEPAPQTAENGEAKTKDGKPFDALLAEVVEQEMPGGKDAAEKGKVVGQRLLAGQELLRGKEPSHAALELPAKPRVEPSRVLELPAKPRSIHSAIQAQATENLVLPAHDEPPALDGEAKLEEAAPIDELKEPQTPEQMQAVLAQVATVVARIVAPPKDAPAPAAKKEVAPSDDNGALTQGPQLPSPPPANDLAPPVAAHEFADALSAFELIPHSEHDVNNALTVRPSASDTEWDLTGQQTQPGEGARGPFERAVQRLADNAPMRAAADKVMNAFRSLSGRADPTSTGPTAPLPQQAPTAPLAASTVPTMNAPMNAPTQAVAPTLGAPTLNAPANAAPTSAVSAPPSARVEVAPNPIAATPLAQESAAEPSAPSPAHPSAMDMPTLRPTADPSAPTPRAPAALASRAPVVLGPAAQVQTTEAQPQVAPTPNPQPVQNVPAPFSASSLLAAQPAHGAPQQVQPVLVQVQQPLGEESAPAAARTEPNTSEPQERVHGFARGGWTGPAMSAYGGRGHEGGERGGGDRGESARSFMREEERATERVSETTNPYIFEPVQPLQEQQLVQPQPQAPEVRAQNVAENQPAPAAPVQELPDIVFQGRPDPTAATENASISLHHPDLGPIQLEVHREQGRVEVHAVIESHHAQAVLRANENGIRQGVQQAGMTFNALRVRLRGEEQPTNRPAQVRRRRNERES